MFVTRDIFYCCKCIQISKISIKKSKAWKLPFSDFPVFHWRNEHLPLICPIFDHVYVNIWSKHMGIAFFRIYLAKWILAPNLTLYVNFLDEGNFILLFENLNPYPKICENYLFPEFNNQYEYLPLIWPFMTILAQVNPIVSRGLQNRNLQFSSGIPSVNENWTLICRVNV